MAQFEERTQPDDGIYMAMLYKRRDYNTKGGTALDGTEKASKLMWLYDFVIFDEVGNETELEATIWAWPSHSDFLKYFDPQKMIPEYQNKQFDVDTLIGKDFQITVETLNGFQKVTSALPPKYGGPTLFDAPAAEPVAAVTAPPSSGLKPVPRATGIPTQTDVVDVFADQ